MAAQQFKLRNGGGSSAILNPAGAAPTTVATPDGGAAVYNPFHGAPTSGDATTAAQRDADAAARQGGARTPLNNMFSDPGNQSLTRDGSVPNSIRPVDNSQKLADASKTAAASQTPAGPAPPPGPGGGSESGPGILEQWFNSRANGTDPGYEYAVGRGTKDLNNQFAARGGYNSGAAIQAIGDYQANMGSQREAQLDALAGGASGEHQGRLNSMFSQGLGLANGQGGISGMYDTGAGNAMNQGNVQAIQMMLDKAGVDTKANQGVVNAFMSLLGLAS